MAYQKLNLYDENGYFDFNAVRTLGIPFNFIIGGRGTGKTYGALHSVKESGDVFMFSRRKANQVDVISNESLSPFKVLNTDFGYNVVPRVINKNISGFYECDEEGKPAGLPIGYITSLKTFTNVRGFDGSDVTVWIYDEFIPEPHDIKIKHEGAAFLNMYESINRNRELTGHPPLQVFCLSNSDNLNSEILNAFDLIPVIEKMQRKGQEYRISQDKLTGIFLLSNSLISQRKRDTVLYKATHDAEFLDVSLGNEFTDVNDPFIQSRPLNDYKPYALVNGVMIYRHKAERLYYVSRHLSGSPRVFSDSDEDKRRFKNTCSDAIIALMYHRFYFEDFLCKTKFYEFIS